MKYLLQFSSFLFILVFPFTLQAQLFEDFEDGTKGSYAPANVTLGTGVWFFNDALLGSAGGDLRNGTQSARVRDGYIQMEFDYPDGLSELSFYASNSNFANDNGGIVQAYYSTNSGSSWNTLGEAITLGSTLDQYTINENIPGNIRIRLEKTAGNRISIDDVQITSFIDSPEDPSLFVRVNDVPYADGETFSFGTTTGSATATMRIRNDGLETLEITGAQINGASFSVDGDLNITLESLQAQNVTLVYSADSPGFDTGSITLTTNDPENESYTLNLEAETLDTGSPISIAEARQLPQGTTVTVAGWITATDQFAGPIYFQDETGGLAWYDNEIMRNNWSIDAIIGDSLVVTGELGNFNNLLQVINYTSYEIFPEGNNPQEPVDITLADLNTGAFEGQLIRMDDVEFVSSGIFSGGTNYDIFDPSDEGQLRIDNFTNLPGANIPNSISQVTGVAGRFINTMQILPRFRSDIVITSGPVIVSAPPYETSSTESTITFEWETQQPGHTEIRFGTSDAFELGSIVDETPKTQHSVTISGLDAASTYAVQLRSAIDADTSATSVYLSSTASPQGSTGQILSFFNKDVAHELTVFREADQNVDFSQQLISFIDQAEVTAEFAFYNISGTVGNDIRDAIIAAHNRGVDVRVIASGHTGNTNPIITALSSAGVPAVQSLGMEQMHNKFAVIDAHHQDPSRSWVVTSSWNATDSGTFQQFQNMLNIQDVALARSYWREFNQMWGGESGPFNASAARFSEFKEVVNASAFWIGEDETYVQLYFSPQANTEAQINRTLAAAEETIDLNLNIFTRRAISNTMLSRFNNGVKVRGVFGQVTGQGNEFDYLSGWADVHHLPQGEFGLLHHKLAIIDGELAGENATVITGSHNWSANANFRNDENTLIIRNARVANEYFQEYGARYWQAGGQDTFNVPPVSIDEPGNELPRRAGLAQNYPNPFNPVTNIQFELPAEQQVSLRIYDITGRVVATLANNERMNAGTHTLSFDASRLASGIYMYRMQLEGGESFTRKMTLIK